MTFDPWTPLEESGKLPKPPGREETLEYIRQHPYVSPKEKQKREAEAKRQAKLAAKQSKPEIPVGSGLRWSKPKGIGRAKKSRFPSLKHGAD